MAANLRISPVVTRRSLRLRVMYASYLKWSLTCERTPWALMAVSTAMITIAAPSFCSDNSPRAASPARMDISIRTAPAPTTATAADVVFPSSVAQRMTPVCRPAQDLLRRAVTTPGVPHDVRPAGRLYTPGGAVRCPVRVSAAGHSQGTEMFLDLEGGAPDPAFGVLAARDWVVDTIP